MSSPVKSYNPTNSIVRDPRTKKDRAEATKDMGAVICQFIGRYGDQYAVTEDDLTGAGFSYGEIRDCLPGARAVANARLAPRKVKRAA